MEKGHTTCHRVATGRNRNNLLSPLLAPCQSAGVSSSMQVALCWCALSPCIISSPATAGFLSAVLFAALHTPDALQCLALLSLAHGGLHHASCSILHCPRRCDECNGICLHFLLLVSPSSRCSHRRLCVYIVQPSRLAACRLACAQCRAWHETPRAAFAKQKSWILLMKQLGSMVPGNRSLVASLFLTLNAILTLSGSMKSIPLVSGILATRLVVGVKVESEDGKYWTSRRDCT